MGGPWMGVLVGRDPLQVGEYGLRGRAAAGECRVVERERPRAVGGRLVEGGVLVVLGRLVRPGLDLAVSGRAVVVQGVQEVRGPARLLLGGAPPVAGADQEGAGRVKVT